MPFPYDVRISWRKGGLRPEMVRLLSTSGMDLTALEHTTVTLSRRAKGTQLHHEACASLRSVRNDLVQERVRFFELTARTHDACMAYGSPLPRHVDYWLDRALPVAAAIEAIGRFERADRLDLAALGPLLAYRPELESLLEELVEEAEARRMTALQPRLLSAAQAEAILARLDRLARRAREDTGAAKLYAAAASAAGSRPPAGSRRAAGAATGSGAGVHIEQAWQAWQQALEANGNLESADAAVRELVESTLDVPLDTEALLAHWLDDLVERIEAGRTPVVVGLPYPPSAGPATFFLTGVLSQKATATTDARVVALPEIVAEQLSSHLALRFFGPAGDKPDELVEIVAGLWGERGGERDLYRAAEVLLADAR